MGKYLAGNLGGLGIGYSGLKFKFGGKYSKKKHHGVEPYDVTFSDGTSVVVQLPTGRHFKKLGLYPEKPDGTLALVKRQNGSMCRYYAYVGGVPSQITDVQYATALNKHKAEQEQANAKAEEDSQAKS